MNSTTNQAGAYQLPGKRQPGYQFVGDRELSTYRWKIFTTHPTSKEEVIIEGYSKDVNSREKDDKQQLLQDCVSRLCNKGYLDRCWYWVVFKRQFTGKDNDTMILELNPHGYMAHDFLTLDIATISWLDRMFTARKTNSQGTLQYKDLLPERKTYKQQQQEDFKFSLERFPNKTLLGNYCRETLLTKYDRNQVLAWFNAKSVHYTTIQQEPPAGATVAGGDKDNDKAARLAQTAMANLTTRFTRGK